MREGATDQDQIINFAEKFIQKTQNIRFGSKDLYVEPATRAGRQISRFILDYGFVPDCGTIGRFQADELENQIRRLGSSCPKILYSALKIANKRIEVGREPIFLSSQPIATKLLLLARVTNGDWTLEGIEAQIDYKIIESREEVGEIRHREIVITNYVVRLAKEAYWPDCPQEILDLWR
jgi:hypothetical protein